MKLDSKKEFQTGFNNVAAYSCYKSNIGQTIIEITKTSAEPLVTANWNEFVTTIDNIWPNHLSKKLADAISDISTYELNGYIIKFSEGNSWWVIAQNYLLLGKAPNKNTEQITCPCESGKPYEACCQPYHNGTPAPTAEALMRSRYTAYVLKLEDYLLTSWHPDTRPSSLGLAEDPPNKWLGLQVKQAKTDGDTAEVEFVARYKIGGKAERLHEISQFKRLDGRWFYLTGSFVNN